jgi:putative ABC transport system permease protein
MREWSEEVLRRLAPLNLRPEREREIADELAQHLADRYEDLRRDGHDEASAEAAALAELSDVLVPELEQTERAAPRHSVIIGGGERDGMWRTIAHDVRYGLRGLRLSPVFSAVAIATLAIGIGACTLIFSAVNGVLLRPLPFKEPDRLVVFWGSAPEKGLPEVDITEGLAVLYRDRARTLEQFAAYGRTGFNLTGDGEAERIEGTAVSVDFFRIFGVAPLLGRTIAAGEDAADAKPVAVISQALWRRRFGGDSNIVGKPITLNGRAGTVIGVMPASFEMPNRGDIWVPLHLDATRFNCWCYSTVARMKPGVTPEDVRADIAGINDDFGMTRPDVFPNARRGGSRVVAMSLSERLVGNIQRPLIVLLAAVGCVLLIACANIANLMLARTAGRAREFAVRCCLGASPRRIALQTLTESVLLSTFGAAAGALLALWGAKWLRTLSPTLFPRIDQVSVDATVLAFTSAVAILTGILCGLAPAIRATRIDFQDAIKNGVRGSSTRSTRRVSDGFVVLQFGLSLILLVGAGLLLRSYRHLSTMDAGYRPNDVITARVQLPYPRYVSPGVVQMFYGNLIARLKGFPGVKAVGIVSLVPLARGNPQDNVIAEGSEEKPGAPVRVANIRTATPGYLPAIGTPLLRGRDFTSGDNDGSLRVAIVDETFAKHFWPTGDAIGKRFTHGGDTTSRRWVTIVGIVPNIKHNRLDEEPDLQVYEPFAQATTWGNYIVVRTTAAPEGVIAEIRRHVRALDPMLPVFEVHTMKSAVDESLATRRLTNTLLAAFSICALLLAAIGIYGVISIAVTGRIREFGIRAALGASGANVRSLVIRHALALAVLGVVLGFVGAMWATRFLQGLLYGVGRFDVATFVAVAAVLTATAIVASYLPARRATRADPMLALRAE